MEHSAYENDEGVGQKLSVFQVRVCHEKEGRCDGLAD